jgi:hypothetical protein
MFRSREHERSDRVEPATTEHAKNKKDPKGGSHANAYHVRVVNSKLATSDSVIVSWLSKLLLPTRRTRAKTIQ